MKSSVLCYNLKDTKKGKQITTIFGFLGFRVRHVEKEEYLRPIGELAGIIKEESDAPACGKEGFEEEMLVIHAECEALLDQALFLMRKDKVTVDLKAMVTPTNQQWASIALHSEIMREHEAMKEMERNKKD